MNGWMPFDLSGLDCRCPPDDYSKVKKSTAAVVVIECGVEGRSGVFGPTSSPVPGSSSALASSLRQLRLNLHLHLHLHLHLKRRRVQEGPLVDTKVVLLGAPLSPSPPAVLGGPPHCCVLGILVLASRLGLALAWLQGPFLGLCVGPFSTFESANQKKDGQPVFSLLTRSTRQRSSAFHHFFINTVAVANLIILDLPPQKKKQSTRFQTARTTLN